MVYGVIDRRGRQYYTYLQDVFAAMENRQTEYNWLITDSEIAAHSRELDALNTGVRRRPENGKQVPVPGPDYCFLSGRELTQIVARDDSQWIWGVLSGFDRSIPREEILKYPLPAANGYTGFWKNPPSIQHPLASVEIVPWDSACVLLFSRSREIVDSFRKAFPECEDLRVFNA